jgi:hypothetical protein
MINGCGAVQGMRIERGHQSTLRKPVPVPLCPSQIPHDMTFGLNLDCCNGMPVTNFLSYGVPHNVFRKEKLRIIF